ncbi:MAG: hypothetical protein ACE5GN_06750 [Waddliaceae bacterium]
MKFTLRGIEFDATSDDVLEVAKELEEGRGRNYAVKIEGRFYAPKDVIYELLNSEFEEDEEIFFTRQDFTTQDAIRILRKLGFNTIECSRLRKREKKLSDLLGLVSLGGDSVKESEEYHG